MNIQTITPPVDKNKMNKSIKLNPFFINDATVEIGVDEAGRGPLLGRVYSAAVILPKDNLLFKHELMKDSKKFHSVKKLNETAEYIKQNAIAWSVAYSSETEIDTINIRRATHKAMHNAIHKTIQNYESNNNNNNNNNNNQIIYHLLIDGNDFTPLYIKDNSSLSSSSNFTQQVYHTCIEDGDNRYSAIAAASILAKVARDAYIEDLCIQYSELNLIDKYDLLKNKGYGTKKHLDGIRRYGITHLHRKTFGICKLFN